MGDAGLFGPGSVTWRVNREGVLLVGGPAAAILQVAHPLVAAGVSDHSRYREDPWGRLYRTLDLTTKIVFGSTETAHAAARAIRMAHRRVKGVTREDAGAYPAGTPYDANDPELGLWVHATLVDTALEVYRRYVGTLTVAEQQRYYEEQKTLGEMVGVPRELQPQTLADFYAYYHGMLESDRIFVTDACRDVVEATMRPELPFIARPVVEAMNLATAGLLPARLREELGLAWGPHRARLLEASRLALSRLIPVLPGLVRQFPPARTADRRARAA